MNIEELLSGADIVIGFLFGLAVLLGGLVLWSRSPDRGVIVGALLAKILFCYAMCALTIPVFNGGDMTGYHHHGIIYAGLLADDLRMGTTDYLSTTPFFLIANNNTVRCRSFSGLVHFLTFNSYVASSVVFAAIGFLGQYNLYRTFTSAYPSPRARAWWAAGLLYMPSMSFWSAGLLKDPLGLWGLGCTVRGSYSLSQGPRFSGVLRVVLGTYAMLLFRAQAASVSMIALAPLLLFSRRRPGMARPSGGARAVGVATRLVCLSAFIAAFVYATLADSRSDFTSLQQSLTDERNNYTNVSGGSTVMDGVEVARDTSVVGLLRLWPESMLFCLFRPYPWESLRSPLLLVAGLENATLLVLTIRAALLAAAGPRALAASLRAPLFLSCVIFVGLFGFALGISTPNLGTISRYRIPVIPFFVGALVILEHDRRERGSTPKAP